MHADAGYIGVEKRAEIIAAHGAVEWRIAKRGKIKSLPESWVKDLTLGFEKLKARARALVEHPFHIVKNLFKHRKVRDRGLKKIMQSPLSRTPESRAGHIPHLHFAHLSSFLNSPMADFTAPAFHTPLLRRFAALLEPCDDEVLERLARESAALTRRHFGKTIRLFAPLYLSNECINSCVYCGFSRENAILRVTLEIDSVVKEARHLAKEGFRNVLLVAGEHPKFVSNGYLEKCVRALAPEVPGLALEVAPMETPDYARLSAAGAEGLVVYQETYHREAYAELHTAGPKRDYDWRLACPERAYEGGFRRIGVGCAFWIGGMARGGLRARGAFGIALTEMLEGAVHGEPAAAASVRGGISAEPSAW